MDVAGELVIERFKQEERKALISVVPLGGRVAKFVVLALALGAVLAAGLVWWGPWAYGTRDGVRRVIAIMARTDTAARVWVVVAVFGVGIVLFALLWRTEPLFWPLAQIPEAAS